MKDFKIVKFYEGDTIPAGSKYQSHQDEVSSSGKLVRAFFLKVPVSSPDRPLDAQTCGDAGFLPDGTTPPEPPPGKSKSGWNFDRRTSGDMTFDLYNAFKYNERAREATEEAKKLLRKYIPTI